ncbi:MAG: Tat pathway signal protein [Lentisphaerae bacterium GWF2_45_14]|nr:MAG: Tat pathway signal protein [Lentisphaerae bacterium GWF2_45_14]
MKIVGTFLDEISHDIPHQNWGREEWDCDFKAMHAMGIDTVVLIRSGHKRWMTYPSEVLAKRENGYMPPVDLVDMYLEFSEKYGMKFFLGTYDSGCYWHNGEYRKELDINKAVVEEVWKKYGHRKAFKGWYLTQEVGRAKLGIIDIYAEMGKFCKSISGGLPVLISPYIKGVKAVWAFSPEINAKDSIGVDTHSKEWNEILSGIQGAVDIMAFQDGHCDYHELADFMVVNKALATRYGMECWTNCESFDRDMPIKFLPIKWEKMLLKLKAAQKAGVERAITFEFSHFMSPNSAYLQAGGLFDRYCEYNNLPARAKDFRG